MNKPISLPVAVVIEAGRKAYLAGKLSAQGPTPECAYRDTSGRPCIIGAAMTNAQAERLIGTVGLLAGSGYIRTDDLLALSDLQDAHDCWARAVAARDDDGGYSYHNDLCALLGLPAPEAAS